MRKWYEVRANGTLVYSGRNKTAAYRERFVQLRLGATVTIAETRC